MALRTKDRQDRAVDIGPDAAGAGKIRDLYTKGTKALRYEHRNAWLNRAFLQGGDGQFTYWSTTQNRLRQLPRDNRRAQIPMDRLMPSSRTTIAKLLRRPLAFDITPTGADDESITGARIAEAVLRDRHREKNWEGLREEAVWASWEGGTGLLALDWDPEAGSHLGVTPGGRNFGTGDIEESALSITEIATEPGTRDIETAGWWIKASALPPEEVKERYKLKTTPAADATAGASPLQNRLMRDGSREDVTPLTLVLTYYERPSNDGDGRVVVVVGSEVVDGPHPWPFPFKDRLNIVCARETRIVGRWTGDTILSHAIGPQMALNQIWSSHIEHAKMAGNARLLVPEVSIDVVERLTDEPGEVVPYTTASGVPAPGYLSPPSMPAWWAEQIPMIEKEIDDILGVHDISRGEAGPNAHSGVALTLLSEQDDTPLGRLAKEHAEMWGRFASLVLEVYQDKVTETRKARIATGSDRPEIVGWTGKKLAGQTRATVPLEAVQPRSRAASFQMALSLKQQFPMDVTPKVFARIADLPGSEDLLSDIDPDTDKQRRENHEMALEIPAIPEMWDDDQKHCDELDRFRKSARYEGLSDKAKHFLQHHFDAHQQQLGEKAARQTAMQSLTPDLAAAHGMASPGAPVAPPPGPQLGQPPPMPGAPGDQSQVPSPEQSPDITAPPGMPGGM